jgi:hypothetical protein
MKLTGDSEVHDSSIFRVKEKAMQETSTKQAARRASLLAACFILELQVSRYYCILKSSIHIFYAQL